MAADLVAVPRGDTPKKGTRGRRLPAAAKVRRDRSVVSDRIRGFPWAIVAQRNGLSEGQCRNTYRQWRKQNAEEAPGSDPKEWLYETLDRFEAIQGQLAVLAETGDNTAARVGALKAQMDAIARQIELLVAAGLLPRNLRAHFDHESASALLKRFFDVIERHNVGEDVLRDLQAVLDSEP